MERHVTHIPGRRTAHALVAAQLGVLAVLLSSAPPQRRPVGRTRQTASMLLMAGGGVLGLSGALSLGSALTPSPLPAPGARLRTSGPYGRTRHPIYAGLVLAAGGRALGTGAARHRVGALALLALLGVKARVEERALLARFPAYADYATRTPAWHLGRGRRRCGH